MDNLNRAAPVREPGSLLATYVKEYEQGQNPSASVLGVLQQQKIQGVSPGTALEIRRVVEPKPTAPLASAKPEAFWTAFMSEQVELQNYRVSYLDFSVLTPERRDMLADEHLHRALGVYPLIYSLNLEGCSFLTGGIFCDFERDHGSGPLLDLAYLWGKPLSSNVFSFLQSLNLKGCKSFTRAGLEGVLRNAPKLEVLELDTLGAYVGKAFVLDVFDKVSGPLPEGLKTLRLEYCRLTSVGLLSLLEKFPKLEELEFVYPEGVNYQLPKKPVESLKRLMIHGKGLDDAGLLAILKTFPNLTHLDVHYNETILAGNVFRSLPEGVLADLESVNFSDCRNLCDGEIWALLSRCHKLKELDLGYCPRLTDKAFHHLPEEALSALEVFKMEVPEGSHLSEVTLFTLLERAHQTLVHFEFRDFHCETIFEEKALACRGITGFPNLETVILTGKLADNYLTIEFFSNAPALKKAELFHCPILGVIAEGGFRNLESLWLEYYCHDLELEDGVLEPGTLAKLKYLEVRHRAGTTFSLLSDNALKQVLLQALQLETLKLGSGTETLTGACFQGLPPEALNKLKQLKWENAERLTDAGLKGLLSNACSLERLNLTASFGPKKAILTAVGLEGLKPIPTMRELKLWNLPAIDFKGLGSILSIMPKLEGLKLCSESFGAHGWDPLPACPSLQMLELWHCRKLNNLCFGYLTKAFSHLKHIRLDGMELLTEAAWGEVPVGLETAHVTRPWGTQKNDLTSKAGVLRLLRRLSRPRKIDLNLVFGAEEKITLSDLVGISAERFKGLEYLSLSAPRDAFDDEALHFILEAALNLRELALHATLTAGLTGQAFRQLPEGSLKQLREMRLVGDNGDSLLREHVVALVRKSPYLKRIELGERCKTLKDSSWFTREENMPTLKEELEAGYPGLHVR
tara:strand:- start:76003 stop:78750 length:2748 start_codon:yes stop_codon:yes gene_type:complete